MLQKEIQRLKLIQKNIRSNYIDIDNIYLPFDISNIIFICINNYNIGIPITNKEKIIEIIHKFCNNLTKLIYGNITSHEKYEIYDMNLLESKYAIYINLSSKQLIKKKITIKGINWILNTILYKIRSAIISPGENIGTWVASSTGEQNTQMNLDSFHFSGDASHALQDFNRLKKIFNVTIWDKNNNRSIYTRIFLPKNKGKDMELVKDIETFFNPTKLKYILKNIKILNDENFFAGKTNEIQDSKYVSYYIKNLDKNLTQKKLYRCIRLEFDIKKMYERKISISDIELIIYKELYNFQLYIVNLNHYIMRIFIYPYSLDMENELDIYEKIKDLILPNINLKGIENIKGIIRSRIPKKKKYYHNNKIQEYEEYIFEANGTNLKEIFKLTNIDNLRTYTNEIWEIYNYLGIEATRNIIYLSIIEVFRSNNMNNLTPNIIAHFADLQTCNGWPTSLKYNGMKSYKDINFIQKITHERYENFIKHAAMYGEIDTMKSPSAAQMYGQAGEYGTNIFTISM